MKRLTDVLAVLDSTLRTVEERAFDPDADALVMGRGGNLTLMTKFGELDVVQRARGVPCYAQLAADAVESELLGVPARICSLGQLRAMKQAAGRAQDQADLANLPGD